MSNLQVVVARVGGRLDIANDAAQYKRSLTTAAAALVPSCRDVEVALQTIRFVQSGKRAATICYTMSDAVRQVFLDAGGIAVTSLPSAVFTHDVRIPLQEYLPIGEGPLIKFGGNHLWSVVSFARNPLRFAETGRLQGRPRTVLGAIVEMGAGQLLLATDGDTPFFLDNGIGFADNEAATELLVAWLLTKR